MDIKDFAKMLDGRRCTHEITSDEEKIAAENEFVVVFGYFVDRCELRGAVHDEIDCYDGGIIRAKGLPKPINAIWCPVDKGCSWFYETDMPHEEFNIFNGDKLFCVGIVIDIKAARLQMNERERLIELLYDWGNKENDGVRAESIADYLLENGVMVLPCKINDHVWFIKSAFSVLAKPLEARVIDIRGISIDRNILYESITLYNDLARRFTSNDIGTKVFLTKKEAEAALNSLIVIPLYVLRMEFGFGKERGQRFAKEFKRIHTAVARGEVSIDTLKSELEYGMDIEVDTNWEDI